MAEALRPSIEITNKQNVNPSINRITEATAEDFQELGQILIDHAEKLDAVNRTDEQAEYYGIHSNLPVLQAAFPNAPNGSWAVIDPGNGNPKQIATVVNGVWEVNQAIAPILLYNTKLDRPSPGVEGIIYVVKDEKIFSLWYDGKYNDFGKDGANGLSAYQIAVAVQGFEGTEIEWLQSIEGADGKDNYQLWLDSGNVGDYNAFFEASRGPEGPEGPVGPAGIDKWKGSFLNLAALQAAFPEGAGQAWHNNEAGWTADVDSGAGAKVQRYVWDASDLKWEVQVGESTSETAASIKTKYESNANTNAFTDNLLNKLNSITEIFTTSLKTNYDAAYTWVNTNGANVLSRLGVLERAAITVSTSRLLEANDHKRKLLITANITLTWPSGGLSPFECNFDVDSTGQLTIADQAGTAGNDLDAPDGKILEAGKMAHAYKRPDNIKLRLKGTWKV